VRDKLAKALEGLPHGPEFRFLDKLLTLEPGRRGTAIYTVRGEEPFLRGHFPGEALFPGVLLVEAAAQLAGTVAQSDTDIPALPHLKLTAIRGIKFTGTARPGESISLEAQITARFGGLIQANVTAKVGDRLVMQGEVTLSGG
jgi:3-hydroxyacyl-[acyl-carrier-protein] dehydratase